MPKKIDKAAKKLEIIKHAMRVFAQKGYAKTKMADVALAAKIGKGTIYEYFKSKDEIFNFVFTHFMDSMETIVAKAIFKLTDPVEKIKTIFTSWAAHITSHENDIMEIMLDFWAEAVRKKDDKEIAMIQLDKIYDDFRRIIQSILEEGIRTGSFKKIDAYYTASLILGAMDGMMIQWILNKELFDIKKATEHSIQVFLTGICVD
ncbi:TetR/AcrR family transcriptional regulator [candidate division KSB1 bacterium]|nr:TetR/AcrR family transcriptional regulator [candidate division KSB1 bacterium]